MRPKLKQKPIRKVLSRYQKRNIAYRLVNFGESVKEIAGYFDVTAAVVYRIRKEYIIWEAKEKYPLSDAEKPTERIRDKRATTLPPTLL